LVTCGITLALSIREKPAGQYIILSKQVKVAGLPNKRSDGEEDYAKDIKRRNTTIIMTSYNLLNVKRIERIGYGRRYK
jgi:hypothetical protein